MLILSVIALLTPLPIQNAEPVSLEVIFEGVPEYDSGWVLTITLKAKEDLEEAEIWVEKSDGIKIESGSPFWHGPLKSGDAEVIEISMRLVGSLPQEITVNLVGRTSDGRRFEKKVYRAIEYISDRV